MDRNARTETVAEQEARLEAAAREHLFADQEPVFTEVANILDGPEEIEELASENPAVVKCLKKLLGMFIADPAGAQLLALKIFHPDMTQDQAAKTLTGLGHEKFAHRARVCQATKRFEERFPEVAVVMTKDTRGGDRHKRIRNNAELLAESERLRAEEQKKPRAQRRPVKGEGSIYQYLAETYGITGQAGKPSWAAVEQRIVRERKKVAASVWKSGYGVATHAQGSLSARTKQNAPALTASQVAELEDLGLPAARSMTLQEVAKALQIAEPSVRRLVKAGLLPAVRVSPRVLRFRPQDVLTFLQQRVTLAP